jgi:uncharacterized protein DUF4160
MKVASDGLFTICVYASEATQRHHLPHCHVRSPNGDVVVALPLLRVLAGKKLSNRARSLLLDNLERICDAWTKLNPESEIKK